MIYVFDTNVFSTLFRNYYPKRFPTLWAYFDEIVKDGRIQSTKEVYREIEDSALSNLREWSGNNPDIFPTPIASEARVVSDIYAVHHFQRNIEQQKLLKGGRNADPWVIARTAHLLNSNEPATLVTQEIFKNNATRIPNICRYFDIACCNLEDFMEHEGWSF